MTFNKKIKSLPTAPDNTECATRDTHAQVEASYRDYHKTAFTAATVHPTEAAQEAQRMRTAVCSLVGLRPPPPPTQDRPGGEGGGEQANPAEEADGAGGRVAAEGPEGGKAEGGEEVRTARVTSRTTKGCPRPSETNPSTSMYVVAMV